LQVNFEGRSAGMRGPHPGWQIVSEGTEGDNHVLRGEGRAWAGLQTNLAWRDYSVRFRFRLLSGRLRAGFRASDAGRYVATFGEGGVQLDKESSGGAFYRLAGIDANFLPEQWNVVEIRAQEQRLAVAVNDRQLIEHVDRDPITNGGVTFETLDGSSAFIDDVIVNVQKSPEGAADQAGVLALRKESRRFSAVGEARELLAAADAAFAGKPEEAEAALRQADGLYREAIAEALWEKLRERLTSRESPISEDQFEAAIDLLDEAQLPGVSADAFLVEVDKIKAGLLSGAGLADLTVSFYQVPYSALTGIDPSPPLTDRPTLITLLVENKGFTQVAKAFSITLHVDGQLHKTWTFSPTSEGEDSSHSKAPLKPGGSRVYTCSLEYSVKGQHTLRIEVDPQGEVEESDKENNILETTAVWQDPPNLKVRSITPVGSPGGGQKSTWKIEVENAGTGDVKTPFLTVFLPQAPGGAYENFWTKSLAAGSSVTFTSTQWFRSSGAFTFGATVDASWAVPEALPDGEKDNELSQSVTLAGVDLVAGKPTITPSVVVNWTPMSMSFTVKNAGSGAATQPFKVRVYPGTISSNGLTQPKELTVTSLQPNQAVTLTHSVTLRPGKYDLSIQVDSTGVYFEKDNDNNNYVSTVECDGMHAGRVYDRDNNISVSEMQTYVEKDPQLDWFRRKVALTALKEAAIDPPMEGDAARDKYDASGSWCSEFVRWIYLQAGMIDISYGSLSLSDVTLNKELVKLFDNNGNRFKWRSKGQVTVQTAEAGDYFSWTTGGKKKNHAVLCVAVNFDGKTIWTVQGNVGDKVWYGTENYFADGKTCNVEIDGIGDIDEGLF
jgi:hypothetical protein